MKWNAYRWLLHIVGDSDYDNGVCGMKLVFCTADITQAYLCTWNKIYRYDLHYAK